MTTRGSAHLAIGRRGALRLGAATGLGLLGSVGSAALVQTGVVPGRVSMWTAGDDLIPTASPSHAGGPVQPLIFRSPFRPYVDTEMLVMSPPGQAVTTGARLPVCLVLHGRGASARAALGLELPGFLADATAAGVPPFAAVAVDGGASYWHPRADGTDTQALLTDDVLPRLAAAGYACGPTDPVAVIGWSMGGYGALLLAETLGAARCAAVGAMSPALWHGFEAARPGAFDDAADFARHDVFAGRARLAGVAVRVDCSLGEVFLQASQDFAASLDPYPAGGFQPGSHNDRYWRRQLPGQLAFVGRALARAHQN